MKIERTIEELIKKLQTGELDPAGQEELQKHLDQNPEYEDILKIHNLLNSSGSMAPEPEVEQFSQMRAAVLRKIRLSEQNSPGRIEQFLNNVRDHAMRPEMAVAALTLIIGFLLGRALPPDENSLSTNIMDQISTLAQGNTKLDDIKKSPYLYTNVSFKEVDPENVALSFDVTTHLDMVSKKSDPLVRDVIAQSLINPSNLGAELKAISYTEGVFDRKIKEALIY